MDQRWTTMYRNCKLNDFSKFNSEIDFTLMDWSGKKTLRNDYLFNFLCGKITKKDTFLRLFSPSSLVQKLYLKNIKVFFVK